MLTAVAFIVTDNPKRGVLRERESGAWALLSLREVQCACFQVRGFPAASVAETGPRGRKERMQHSRCARRRVGGEVRAMHVRLSAGGCSAGGGQPADKCERVGRERVSSGRFRSSQ